MPGTCTQCGKLSRLIQLTDHPDFHDGGYCEKCMDSFKPEKTINRETLYRRLMLHGYTHSTRVRICDAAFDESQDDMLVQL